MEKSSGMNELNSFDHLEANHEGGFKIELFSAGIEKLL